MRIGILTHNYPLTAADRKDAGIFVFDFAHELAKQVKVFVFCPNFSGKKEAYKMVPVTWFNWSGGKEKFGDWNIFNPLSFLKFFNLVDSGKKEVLGFIKKNKIDFCLACWALPSGMFALEAKKILGVPYVVWSLGSDINKYARYPLLRKEIVKNLKNANLRFANSFLLAKKVELLANKKCEFLPAITDFGIEGIKSQKLDKDKFNFLFVGRLEKVKGPDVLIEACYHLKKKSLNFTASFLGDGKLLNSLKNKVVSLGLAGIVNLYGRASKEVVASYMLSVDVLVIPSRSESLPLVLLEAIKAGLPVLATNVGDCPRLIRNYKIGRVVEKDNPEGLAGGMASFMRDKENLGLKYKKGLEKLDKEFCQQKAVNIFLEATKSLI